MHLYKVHLPQQNNWDNDDNMLDSFYISGINRDGSDTHLEVEDIDKDDYTKSPI